MYLIAEKESQGWKNSHRAGRGVWGQIVVLFGHLRQALRWERNSLQKKSGIKRSGDWKGAGECVLMTGDFVRAGQDAEVPKV